MPQLDFTTSFFLVRKHATLDLAVTTRSSTSGSLTVINRVSNYPYQVDISFSCNERLSSHLTTRHLVIPQRAFVFSYDICHLNSLCRAVVNVVTTSS
ncbi:hypothetical protein MRB53_037250 [Persea americana]|nr:hypothetical protein MRB53_037250 [Persea americana]